MFQVLFMFLLTACGEKETDTNMEVLPEMEEFTEEETTPEESTQEESTQEGAASEETQQQ